MPQLRSAPRACTVLLTVALLAGCSSGTDGAASSSTRATVGATTSSASPPPPMAGVTEAEEAPGDASFPASIADDSGSAQAGAAKDPAGTMKVTGLRLTPQNGYDRLVIDVSTAGVPDWRAQYTEASGPIGTSVTIAGDAFLRVSLFTQAKSNITTESISAAGAGVVAEARSTGFSAGYEEVLIGVRGAAAPFRAFTLTDPGRIVVDIRPAG